MSYSFNVLAPTKDEALVKVSEELTKIVVAQPVHRADQEAVQGAVAVFVDLLATDDTQDVGISVSGSIWKTDAGVRQASVGVNVGFAPRKAAASG
jgi:hypothetical protein